MPRKSIRFFTGRVYQGAEGYIYPYPLYDILTEKKIEKDYNVLRLNNQYVDIAILPEIGGRIFAASDKTNDYPFFYTQTGIKPALIGMLEHGFQVVSSGIFPIIIVPAAICLSIGQ